MTQQTSAPARKAGKPIWPKVPAGFVRAVLAGHSALGLAFAALIYLVCFSGTVAVFAHEFERWEHPTAPMTQAVAPDAVQRAMAAGQAQFGAPAEHVFMTLPIPELPRFQLTFDADQGANRKTWFADASGQLAGRAEAAWTQFMIDLHIYLHLPRSWGMFVVGLTGVALLSSLISGVLAHPRVFKDSFHLRRGGSKRLQEADLHNRIGVWALPFHVLVSLTGALLGLTTVVVGVLAMVVFQGDMDRVYEMFLGPHPVDDPRAAPMIDVRPPLAAISQLSPGAIPTYVGVEHPHERGQAVLIIARQPDRLSLGDNFTFDGQGQLIHTARVDQSTLGEQVLGVLGVLHFGWFGGWPIKVAYGLLGAGLTTVTSSGVAIWLARRRDKGRPAPRWERVWIATVWSQPFAFGLSLALALLVPGVPPLVTWAAATLGACATALAWAPAMISRRLRQASGLVLIGAPIIHVAQHAGGSVDPMAWIVNASLAGLGLLAIASTLSRQAQPERATAGARA